MPTGFGTAGGICCPHLRSFSKIRSCQVKDVQISHDQDRKDRYEHVQNQAFHLLGLIQKTYRHLSQVPFQCYYSAVYYKNHETYAEWLVLKTQFALVWDIRRVIIQQLDYVGQVVWAGWVCEVGQLGNLGYRPSPIEKIRLAWI